MASFSSPSYVNSSSSTFITAFPTPLQGVFISSATGATLAIFDSNNSLVFTPALVSSFTPASIGFYPMPFNAKNGLNVSIAGTITYTVAFG